MDDGGQIQFLWSHLVKATCSFVLFFLTSKTTAKNRPGWSSDEETFSHVFSHSCNFGYLILISSYVLPACIAGSDGSKCRFDRLDCLDQIIHCLSTAVELHVPFISQRLRWNHYIFCVNKVCLALCKSVCSCVWVNNPFLCCDSAFTRRWNSHHSWYHTLLVASIISCTCFSAALIVSPIVQEVNLSTCPLQSRLSQTFLLNLKKVWKKNTFFKNTTGSRQRQLPPDANESVKLDKNTCRVYVVGQLIDQ